MIHNDNNVISVREWIQPTQERTKKSNWVWVITSAMELEVNQDLKPSRKIKKPTRFAEAIVRGPTIANNVISVHEWTQPAQQRTTKSNWVWVITSAMELEVNQDLKSS